MLFVFLLAIGVLAVGVYLLFILTQVPGAADERLGKLEELPSDLGRWVEDRESPSGRAAEERGLVLERRCLYQQGFLAGGRFLHQSRLRDPETREIVSVEPEVIVKRRRLKG